jgi:hypothetical protein
MKFRNFGKKSLTELKSCKQQRFELWNGPFKI